MSQIAEKESIEKKNNIPSSKEDTSDKADNAKKEEQTKSKPSNSKGESSDSMQKKQPAKESESSKPTKNEKNTQSNPKTNSKAPKASKPNKDNKKNNSGTPAKSKQYNKKEKNSSSSSSPFRDEKKSSTSPKPKNHNTTSTNVNQNKNGIVHQEVPSKINISSFSTKDYPMLKCEKCYSIPIVKIISPNVISKECLKCKKKETLRIKDFIRKYQKQGITLNYCNYDESVHTKISSDNNKCQKIDENTTKTHNSSNPIGNIKKVHAVNYCLNCKKFICKDCLIKHNDDYSNHGLVTTSNLNIDIKCKSEGHSSEKIEYYCISCNEHLCKKCVEKNIKHSNHKIINLLQLQNEKINISDLNTNYQSSVDFLTKKLVIYIENYINKLKETIGKLKNSLEKNSEINNNLLKVFDILYQNYTKISGFPNYSAISNVISNCDFATNINYQYEKEEGETESIFSLLNKEEFDKEIPNELYDEGICRLTSYDIININDLLISLDNTYILETKPFDYTQFYLKNNDSEDEHKDINSKDKEAESNPKGKKGKKGKNAKSDTNANSNNKNINSSPEKETNQDDNFFLFPLKNIIDFKYEKSISEHKDSINFLLLLSDGRLASCSDDNSIKVYSQKYFDYLFSIYGHTDYVNFISEFTHTLTTDDVESFIISSSKDSTFRIWRLKKLEPYYEAYDQMKFYGLNIKQVYALTTGQKNDYVMPKFYAVYTVDNLDLFKSSIKILKGEFGKFEIVYDIVPSDYIDVINVISNGQIVAFSKKNLFFYSELDYQLEHNVDIFNGLNTCLAPKNNLIEVPGNRLIAVDGYNIFIINLSSYSLEKVIQSMEYIYSFLLFNNYQYCLISDNYGKMKAIDLCSEKVVTTKKRFGFNSVMCLIRDGYMAAGSFDNCLRFWKFG